MGATFTTAAAKRVVPRGPMQALVQWNTPYPYPATGQYGSAPYGTYLGYWKRIVDSFTRYWSDSRLVAEKAFGADIPNAAYWHSMERYFHTFANPTIMIASLRNAQNEALMHGNDPFWKAVAMPTGVYPGTDEEIAVLARHAWHHSLTLLKL